MLLLSGGSAGGGAVGPGLDTAAVHAALDEEVAVDALRVDERRA